MDRFISFFLSPWLYGSWGTSAALCTLRFETAFFDSWQDSLNEKSARRKASVYTVQHNTERREQTSMP
jgi:hypothetical protein